MVSKNNLSYMLVILAATLVSGSAEARVLVQPPESPKFNEQPSGVQEINCGPGDGIFTPLGGDNLDIGECSVKAYGSTLGDPGVTTVGTLQDCHDRVCDSAPVRLGQKMRQAFRYGTVD